VKNGKLLQLAAKQFDLLLTVDRNLEYQQNFAGLSLAVIVVRAPSSEIAVRSYVSVFVSDYAKTVAEWIAAKRDGRACSAFEFLLALRASIQCLGQEGLKVIDVEVDVNWSPVSVIPTYVVSSFRRFCSRWFLSQSDLGVTAFENDIRSDRSGDLGKSQSIAIKS
jgi:hypothetical protein